MRVNSFVKYDGRVNDADWELMTHADEAIDQSLAAPVTRNSAVGTLQPETLIWKRSMPAKTHEQSAWSLRTLLRRIKYYVLINAFICGVAFVSHQIITRVHQDLAASLVALYGASLLRIVCIITWFNWIATKKPKIYGAKRMQLSSRERYAIYVRVATMVVPTECLSFWLAQPTLLETAKASDPLSVLLEFALFIPKSLLFELIFDFFHFSAHWTCHQISWLYKHVHKRHHMHLHPCPLSTYEQDIIDLCLTNVLPFVLASQLSLPFSAWQLQMLFAYKTYVEVAGHCGLEVKGFSFPQMPLVNLIPLLRLCVHDHDLHHTHPKWNFAKRFSMWDKLFRTFRSGTSLGRTAAAAAAS